MVKEIESEIDWSEPLENVLPDFSKSGPLDVYRKQCSFNWREMASTLDDEEAIRIKVRFFQLNPKYSEYLSFIIIV